MFQCLEGWLLDFLNLGIVQLRNKKLLTDFSISTTNPTGSQSFKRKNVSLITEFNLLQQASEVCPDFIA